MKFNITEYNGICLYYEEDDGKIYFTFEGQDRRANYIFEAKNIIDEPRWEECALTGYFVDGYIDLFIGTAIATRKDKKNGSPDWLLRGQYDADYKKPQFSDREKTVFPKNDKNDQVYVEWKDQREVYYSELHKLNNIVKKLQKETK